MSAHVKLLRGTSTQNDAFTGAEGVVTVDTTNKRLRLHDGATAGGWALAKLSEILASSSLGSGVAAALGIAVGTIGGIVTRNGALGTPSSGDLSNCNNLPIGGVANIGALTVIGNPTESSAAPQAMSSLPATVTNTSMTNWMATLPTSPASISTGEWWNNGGIPTQAE